MRDAGRGLGEVALDWGVFSWIGRGSELDQLGIGSWESGDCNGDRIGFSSSASEDGS